jgi:hypothetical protein
VANFLSRAHVQKAGRPDGRKNRNTSRTEIAATFLSPHHNGKIRTRRSARFRYQSEQLHASRTGSFAAVLGLTTGGTIERFSEAGSYGEMKDVLYSVRRCILEYLGLEVMEPFVAYAALRVDVAVRAEYLRSWEARLLATVGDQAWHAHLSGLAETAAQNRMGSEEKAWAAPR